MRQEAFHGNMVRTSGNCQENVPYRNLTSKFGLYNFYFLALSNNCFNYLLIWATKSLTFAILKFYRWASGYFHNYPSFSVFYRVKEQEWNVKKEDMDFIFFLYYLSIVHP
jgi:hypothetical protein